RFERVADDVAEASTAGKRILLNQVRGAVRVHERKLTEFLHLRPEDVELRQREALVVDVPANGDRARAEPFGRVLEHLCSDVRKLEWNRRHRHKPIRVLFAPRRKRLVVLVADRPGESLVLDFPPPEIVDADGFDVDANFVHRSNAIVELGTGGAIFFVWRAFHDVAERHIPMRMYVNDLDAFAGDADLPPWRRRLRA